MHTHVPATYLQILPTTPHNKTASKTASNTTFSTIPLTMSNTNDPNQEKRSSFSLSSGFRSVKRAVSGSRGKKSGKEAEASSSSGNLDSSNPFADPPPAYTASSAEGSSQQAEKDPAQQHPSRVLSLYSRLRGPGSETDPFRFLAEFDTVFLIDDSGSMEWCAKVDRNPRQGQITRWDQTRNVIEQIVPICMKYDQDGVDVYFLNDPYLMHMKAPREGEPSWTIDRDADEGKASFGYIGVKNPDDVRRIFQRRTPGSGTPTGKRLGEIMETYVNCYEQREKRGQPLPKPLNIIVITDGAAQDNDILTRKLIEVAQKLDQLSAPYHQMGVQFFQVGEDEGAARFLAGLDDNLGRHVAGQELRDIVDCVTHEQLSSKLGDSQLTGDILLKAVLGSVNKHLDSQRIRQGLLVNPKP
ncbi:hypothetical protein O1611_g6467 [Lasiodiplodia mahajangana]|uniref:Uncharacterized protein n=1 Tax=Lasiodiplodia mahajangana TaxID=1108764 RepID=A0ACC2JIB1_9PEZI|nr:hypothetical protein O1611_g6467 [Lasiodiplodia mahajangana]